jgi:type III restriction enzyme
MDNRFFSNPILNSPYAYPQRHWELDDQGQPTQSILPTRRPASFITPIPKARKQRGAPKQAEILFDEGLGLSSAEQQYDPNSIINPLRRELEKWRLIPNPGDWQVTPETARLLQHWRHHEFTGVRPFFCQVEAIEAAIWLTEVGPRNKAGRDILDHLKRANEDANPGLLRLALKLATGAGKTTVMAMLIAWQTVNAVRSSTRTTTRRAFSSATPTSWERTIPTRPSRRP